MYFCGVLCIVCAYMCTVLLPPGGYPIAVKYIISYHIYFHSVNPYRITKSIWIPGRVNGNFLCLCILIVLCLCRPILIVMYALLCILLTLSLIAPVHGVRFYWAAYSGGRCGN